MKWLRRLLRRATPPALAPRRAPVDDSRGADAVRQARVDLGEAQGLWPEVRAVSGSLRQLRERNHFGEQLEHIFQGGPRT